MNIQGIGIYFYVPGNYQIFRRIFTSKSNKSNKFLRTNYFFAADHRSDCDFAVKTVPGTSALLG
jgi:hypothetical protein